VKLYPKQFLDLDARFADPEKARVAILPFPYEGGVSYGAKTAQAPDAVIDASHYLELYDEALKTEPYRAGIVTVSPPAIPTDHAAMAVAVYRETQTLIKNQKFVVLLGGDHSISSGFFRALREEYGTLSAIQIDAHADLRDSYQGSKLSHACVMARIRELTPHTLQIGIRSMSIEEAERIEREDLSVCTMSDFRRGKFDIDAALENLPDPVFITVDVDAFDWSVIMSTGTPEPGGFTWDEAMDLLENIFTQKRVVGFDVVELSYSETDKNSAFAVAKLIYKMLGFKFAADVFRGKR
jgi:agmatinase